MKEQVRAWLNERSFGTMEQMRVELELRFKGEQVWLETHDRKKLDCMWIPGVNTLTDDSFVAEEAFETLPTMLFCNPNAAFYEYVYYNSEWLDYYVNMGINVFLWNYRGYGRSQGSPSPSALMRDGETIVDYLRNERGVMKLGVHGQSLGGAVACHLGRSGGVDFVFADRTFSSVYETGRALLGSVAGFAYRVFMCGGDFNSTSSFVYANTYKVLACDPGDTIILENSSLKTGIARELIKSELQNRDLRMTYGVKRIKEKELVDMDEYTHILNVQETRIFFDTLRDIYKLYLDYSSPPGFDYRRRGGRT